MGKNHKVDISKSHLFNYSRRDIKKFTTQKDETKTQSGASLLVNKTDKMSFSTNMLDTMKTRKQGSLRNNLGFDKSKWTQM